MSDEEGPKARGDTAKNQANPGDAVPSTTMFESWLDRKLKTAYGSVLDEQIPQELIDLLRTKLDKPGA